MARLGTVTAEGRPHVVPCCFAVEGDVLYTGVDDVKAKRTTALRRLENIARHPEVTVLVDHYDDDWSALWWIRLDGRATVVDAGSPDGDVGRELLAAKYEQYRATPIERAVVVVEIRRWRAWP